jgi:allene oxide cyclase-like protein
MKAALLLIATLGAVVVTYAAQSAAAPSSWTTEHYVTKESWHAFADVGPKDNGGPGDIYAAQQQLKTSDGRATGVVNGYGVNLHPPYVFFHWTATLDGGTLTVDGAIDLKAKTSVYPIEGGTGRYAGARGTVTLADAGSKGSLVTIRYRP